MKYKLGKYQYFDFLVLLNNHYLNMKRIGDNVREQDEDTLNLYNLLLENFFKNLNSTNSIEEIIELSLNLTGFLWYRQPFYDANTRTLHIFLNLLFKELNYKINAETNVSVLPLFYSDIDRCDKKDIDDFKRCLTRIK